MADAVTSATTCAYCLSPIGPEEGTEMCPACYAVYHRECWQENGGCGVYGCTQTPVVEARRAIEVPISYWGQENKPCPSCGQQILAAALRCRHCGTTFSSARPEDSAQFQVRTALQDRLPEVRKRVVTIFVLSLVPFLAPVGTMWGLIWRRTHREELAALPPLYGALHKIGLITGAALTIALAGLTALYVVFREG